MRIRQVQQDAVATGEMFTVHRPRVFSFSSQHQHPHASNTHRPPLPKQLSPALGLLIRFSPSHRLFSSWSYVDTPQHRSEAYFLDQEPRLLQDEGS